MAEEKQKAVKCLRELRNLLTDDEDLKLPIHDEKFLIRFVRAKKYDAELAHQTVRNYYTSRKKNPKISKYLYPTYEPVKFALEHDHVGKLKLNDNEGRPTVYFNNTGWDMVQMNLDNFVGALTLVVEELLLFSMDAQMNGINVIVDLTGLSMTQIKEYSLGRIKAILSLWQGSYPLRVNRICMVNEPQVFEVVYSLFKPFMTEKLKSRMLFTGSDREKLHTVLPPKILPEKYGGKLKDDEASDKKFIQSIFKNDSYYKELVEYGFENYDSEDEDTYM